ncbi:hypothetical protein CSKR_201103 [Clonorchis sinensis]|uniref:C2H2-type domain-containing protein n=2 Tax=Clonorchis sinensis TaxID=79923 RepID=A0A8T1MKY1_CLOSI|nr:hypothetical protein CSKR_201103 [Clonorchis sinensis]
MAAESIKKELSGIFERLNTLSPSEKNNLLVFFKCFLPPNFSDGETSDQQPTQSSEETGSKEEVIPALSQGILPDPSSNTLSLVDNSATYAPDMYSFHCSAQTLDKSVNVPEDGVRTKNSTEVSSEHSPTNETSQLPTNRVSLLYCPICREEFNTWPLMEEHLYESHVTPIAPVCWRCQGVFANHSLLLAHECFDWGRLNLPCQAVVDGSTVAASRRRAILQNSSHLGYPPDGVFLKRRCGLCFKSTALFTNYHSFRRHKESEHPSESTQVLSSADRTGWNKHKRFDTNFEDEFSHPQSVEALRSTLQRLMTQFQAQPKDRCAKSNKRRKRFFRSRAKRLSAALNASLLHAQPSSCTSSPRPDSVTDDAPDTPAAVPSNDFVDPCSTGLTTGTSCWRSYPGYSGNMSLSKRLRLHRKRAPVVSTTRDSPYFRGSRYDNPYNRIYGTMIGRFACKCCSATFRVASRLRAHYLFKHGHIPQSLGGLSPTADEATASSRNRIVQSSVKLASRLGSKRERHSKHHTRRASQNQQPSISVNSSCLPDHLENDPMISSTASTLNNSAESPRTPGPRKSIRGFPVDWLSSPGTCATEAAVSEEAAPPGGTCPEGETTGPPYKCRFCTQSYAVLYSLQRHHTQVHLGEYRFNCGYCEFKSNERCAFDEHLARHFGLKQFVCEFCGAGFTVSRELRDHLAFRHSSERKFQCPMCERTFKTAGTLSRHKKIHGNRVLHECGMCDQKFTRMSNLKRHFQRSHQPKNTVTPAVATDSSKKRGVRTQKSTVEQHPTKASAYHPVTETELPRMESASDSVIPDENTGSELLAPVSYSVGTHINSTLGREPGCNSRSVDTAFAGTLPAVSTVFMPYLSSQPSSLHRPMRHTADSPQPPDSSSSYQTVMFTSLIPLQMPTSLLSPSVQPPADSAETMPWSCPTQNIESSVCYLLNPATTSTNTTTASGTHLVASTQQDIPCVTSTSGELNIISLTGEDHPSTSSSDLCNAFEASHHDGQDALYSCPSYQPELTLHSRMDTTPVPNPIESINLDHIWRPVECDLRSVRNPPNTNSVLTSNNLSLPLLSPFCSETDGRPDAVDSHELVNPGEKVLEHCSPRFPSPVSCTLSPQINVYANSPLHQPNFSTYETAPFLSTHAPSQSPLPSPSHTHTGEREALTNQSFENQNNLPMHLLVCDSSTTHTHFLPPIWSCAPHLDSLQPYSTTVISPNEHHPGSTIDPQCSNFSVGYLIGQNQSYETMKSDQSEDCTLPTSSSSGHYFGYNQSVS